MPQLSHQKYRPDIDGLRAIAVLSVVGFHAFPSWIHGGFVGVDIFFVISGYLISTIIFGNLEKGSFSYAEFYARRIKRIFPALILVLTSSFAFGWHFLFANEFQQLGKHIASGAGFVSNFTLWIESGYFDSDSKTKPLLHLWSLGIEEQFYILWPLLLGLVWKYKWNFLTLTLLVAIVSFLLNVFTIADDPTGTFYSPLSRFWELMIGGLLAYLTLHHPDSLPKTHWQSTAGLILIVLAIFLVNDHSQFPGWWALLPTIGTFLIISAHPNAWLNQICSQQPIVFIGLISYPLYLWHWPLLSFVRIIESSLSATTSMVAVLVSVALAWLTYRFIERPIQNYKWGSSRVVTIALCVAMTIICFIGFNIYERNGLPFRAINKADISGGFRYDYESGYRHNKCFIDTNDSRSNTFSFASFCNGIPKDTKPKSLVLLWGDSHAASLYQGLYKQTKAFNFDLAQYNASSCPPIADFAVNDQKKCSRINRYVLQKIQELRPDTVILSAYWSAYDELLGKRDYVKLKQTIQLLKNFGVTHIVLVGHLPFFETIQPDIGIREFVAGKADRTYRSFNPLSAKVNEQIKAIAEETRVEFISPIDLLCNTEGCLISTSRIKLIPLAWDNAHLTEEGSALLINLAISNQMLHLPPN